MYRCKTFHVVFMAVFSSMMLLGSSEVGNAQGKVDMSEALGGVKLGGHIHSIASSLNNEYSGSSDNDSSAVDVNSVELGLTASPIRAVDANVTLLMEEGFPDGGTPGQEFAVDQAYVMISGTGRMLVDREERQNYSVNPFYAQIGKQYIPFGTNMVYHTFDVISEPQTLAMAETLESAFKFGYTPSSGLNIHAGVFTGAGNETPGTMSDDADIDDFFAGLDVGNGMGSFSVQWMSNLNNSIALSEEAGAAGKVGGLNMYGGLKKDPFHFQVSHVRALQKYGSGSLVTDIIPSEAEPTATTLEATVSNLPVNSTLVYEQTNEWKNHPESVYGLVLDKNLLTGVTGSMEFISREYDSTYSTMKDDETLIAARLAVGFEDLFTGDQPD